MSLPNCQPRGIKNQGTYQLPLAITHPQGVQAQAMQLLPWPLGFFFQRVFVHRWYCSIPLQLLSYCLSLTQCMCSVQLDLEAKSHPESVGPVTITLICSLTYALPVFTGTIWEEKGFIVFPPSGYTSTGHHHSYQIFPPGHHPLLWVSFYALIGDVPP